MAMSQSCSWRKTQRAVMMAATKVSKRSTRQILRRSWPARKLKRLPESSSWGRCPPPRRMTQIGRDSESWARERLLKKSRRKRFRRNRGTATQFDQLQPRPGHASASGFGKAFAYYFFVSWCQLPCAGCVRLGAASFKFWFFFGDYGTPAWVVGDYMYNLEGLVVFFFQEKDVLATFCASA